MEINLKKPFVCIVFLDAERFRALLEYAVLNQIGTEYVLIGDLCVSYCIGNFIFRCL